MYNRSDVDGGDNSNRFPNKNVFGQTSDKDVLTALIFLSGYLCNVGEKLELKKLVKLVIS